VRREVNPAGAAALLTGRPVLDTLTDPPGYGNTSRRMISWKRGSPRSGSAQRANPEPGDERETVMLQGFMQTGGEMVIIESLPSESLDVVCG
jgi:hypothetical protein